MAKATDYMDDVKRYDEGADENAIQKICNYLGVALLNKNASLVSCSNEKERNRIRDGFCAKKLGMDTAAAETAIEAVCQQMKGDKFKKRVTFYHLLTKQ